MPPRAAGRWVGAEGAGALNATSFGLRAGGGPLREGPQPPAHPEWEGPWKTGGRGSSRSPPGARLRGGTRTRLARLAAARGPEARSWQRGGASRPQCPLRPPPRQAAGMRGIRVRRGTAGHPRPSPAAAFPGCPLTPLQPPPGGGRRGRLRCQAGQRACSPTTAPGHRHRPPRLTGRKRPPGRGGREAGDRACERHRGQDCSAGRFLRSERCLLVLYSFQCPQPSHEVCIITPILQTGKLRLGRRMTCSRSQD